MEHTIIALGALRGLSVNETPQDRAYNTSLQASQGKTFISYKIKNVSRLPAKETHDVSLLNLIDRR